jgi:hypothetical protein
MFGEHVSNAGKACHEECTLKFQMRVGARVIHLFESECSEIQMEQHAERLCLEFVERPTTSQQPMRLFLFTYLFEASVVLSFKRRREPMRALATQTST